MKVLNVVLFFCLSCSWTQIAHAGEVEYANVISNAVVFLEQQYSGVDNEKLCSMYRTRVSALETQYANAMMEYDWELSFYGAYEQSSAFFNHDRNADQIEKMRLLLDGYLRERVLIERLMSLEEKRSLIQSNKQNMAFIICDIDEFINRLSSAKKVEYREVKVLYTESGSDIKSITVEDPEKIDNLYRFLLGQEFEYKPELARQVLLKKPDPDKGWGYAGYGHLPSTMLISNMDGFSVGKFLVVDDQDYVRISDYKFYGSNAHSFGSVIQCRSKAYLYRHDEGDSLVKHVTETLASHSS